MEQKLAKEESSGTDTSTTETSVNGETDKDSVKTQIINLVSTENETKDNSSNTVISAEKTVVHETKNIVNNNKK